MSDAPRPLSARGTDWRAAFGVEVIFRDRCWETCGGGYCCKPTRVQRHFSILRKTGVELPLLPGELAFLRASGHLQAGFEGDLSRHEVRAREDVVFPVYRTVCRLDGLCSDHAYRPMVCRLYPWAPIPTAQGALRGMEEMAVYDGLWELVQGADNPCTVGDLTPDELERYQWVCAELFKDPVNIFYLGAAALFKAALRRGARERHPRLRALDEASLFGTWEKLLVFGQLYDPRVVLGQIARWHDELKAHWGDDFSLAGL